jgi:hypothetical protein
LHRGFDEHIWPKQDHTSYAGEMPRGRSPLNTLVLARADISKVMIGLDPRQMQPSFGFKCIKPPNARMVDSKRESDALHRLSLKPFYFGAPFHPLRAWHRGELGQRVSSNQMFLLWSSWKYSRSMVVFAASHVVRAVGGISLILREPHQSSMRSSLWSRIVRSTASPSRLAALCTAIASPSGPIT